jgi:hypothetical protein
VLGTNQVNWKKGKWVGEGGGNGVCMDVNIRLISHTHSPSFANMKMRLMRTLHDKFVTFIRNNIIYYRSFEYDCCYIGAMWIHVPYLIAHDNIYHTTGVLVPQMLIFSCLRLLSNEGISSTNILFLGSYFSYC